MNFIALLLSLLVENDAVEHGGCACVSDGIREKENKQVLHAAAVQRHLYVRLGREEERPTGRGAARASHERTYRGSRVITVKILNHAVTVISFACDRYRDTVKYRGALRPRAKRISRTPRVAH